MYLALFGLVVGCEAAKVSNTEVATNTKASSSINLTDDEVKDILNGLIPKAVNIYGIFNGNGAFTSDAAKTIPGEEEYCLITGQNGSSSI